MGLVDPPAPSILDQEHFWSEYLPFEKAPGPGQDHGQPPPRTGPHRHSKKAEGPRISTKYDEALRGKEWG